MAASGTNPPRFHQAGFDDTTRGFVGGGTGYPRVYAPGQGYVEYKGVDGQPVDRAGTMDRSMLRNACGMLAFLGLSTTERFTNHGDGFSAYVCVAATATADGPIHPVLSWTVPAGVTIEDLDLRATSKRWPLPEPEITGPVAMPDGKTWLTARPGGPEAP